jgi:hypothetical protein
MDTGTSGTFGEGFIGRGQMDGSSSGEPRPVYMIVKNNVIEKFST